MGRSCRCPSYHRARPTIAVPQSQVIAGNGAFGLHPALAPLLPLWQGGTLAAVHAVGQPNPTSSHFAAMAELERAAAGTALRSGWLDRMLGVTGATGPLAGVSVGSLSADKLVAGDLAATTDYRAVIGELLRQRCGFGALDGVFPQVTPSSFGLATAR